MFHSFSRMGFAEACTNTFTFPMKILSGTLWKANTGIFMAINKKRNKFFLVISEAKDEMID
jgi:hypothetical protein